MKKLVVIAILCIIAIAAKAVKLTEGSLDCLKDQKNIVISLDLSKAVYRKNLTADDFLKTAPRSAEWKKLSLEEFKEEFNEKTSKIGFVANLNGDCSYEIQIAPSEISKSGVFKDVIVTIIDVATKESKAKIVLDSEEGDDDDEIAFRDTLSDLGEQLGKFFYSKLKKLR